MIEIKSCPFCGKSGTATVITGSELMDEEQEYWQHSASYAVVCDAATSGGKGGCGAMGGFAETEAAAIANWNTRSDHLRAAQVSVLREARDRLAVTRETNPLLMLDCMADELEKSLPTALHEIPKRNNGINAAGGTLSNPDAADDTPRKPR